MVSLVIDGAPVGKGRPRKGANGQMYTPQKTRDYETRIQLEYNRQGYRGIAFAPDVPLQLQIDAYFAIPKSKSKKVKEQMSRWVILPTIKPDFDNIAKIVCDALNGVAYYDDKQIVNAQINKRYSTAPRVVISIERLDYTTSIDSKCITN
ncbi:MAG: RusA family crossover junction endodeoxyribonuclease [Clostridiales bacterium]|nr:RusA family crossover junction endodeoxyribonuclease [Clostridiales bacterium]